MIPTSYYLALSAILFAIGVAGVLLRRNAIILFMAIELMLNSANLVFVAYSPQSPTPSWLQREYLHEFAREDTVYQ